MTTFNKDKLRFLGMEEEENYMYVVINHTEIDMEYIFIDDFDEAVECYNTQNGTYKKLYKIGYNAYNSVMRRGYGKYKINN
jgi:hypothetical protein